MEAGVPSPKMFSLLNSGFAFVVTNSPNVVSFNSSNVDIISNFSKSKDELRHLIIILFFPLNNFKLLIYRSVYSFLSNLILWFMLFKELLIVIFNNSFNLILSLHFNLKLIFPVKLWVAVTSNLIVEPFVKET